MIRPDLFRHLPATAGAALALAGFIAMAPPASAGPDHTALRERALGVLEAQFGAFRQESGKLAAASSAYCAGTLAEAEYLDRLKTTWLTWAPLDAWQFGPIEQRAAVLTIAFWPDKKDYVGRGLKALTALPEERLADPATIAAGSAAAQGLPALARLMVSDLPACPAVIGISAHLNDLADTLYADWFDDNGWADLMRQAGPDNPVYLTGAEVTKALFSSITFELTVIADMRLGRPLGSFDKPRPKRAEARRIGLSLAIIDAQLAGLADMLREGFAGDVPDAARQKLLDAIAETRRRIGKIGLPLDKAVDDPMTRIRVEGLQTQVRYLFALFSEEIGPSLGVESGFSPADGD
ncbi:MAG: hypothetical protein CSA74_10875 [Rhodobacterales bacterium]|nr:MAG: hypothetical protein CSA74_10875 [Rhodobacterales bacterium]